MTSSPVAAPGYCAQDGGEGVECTELTRALDRLGLGALQKATIDRRIKQI